MFNIDKILLELINDKEIIELLGEDSQSDIKEKIKQKQQEKIRKNRQEKLKGAKNEKKELQDEEGSPDSDQKLAKLKVDNLPDITPEQVAEKINSIRAGKSLKDKGTLQNLAQYFQRLNGPERIALYAFLQGLAKVLGGKDGEQIKTPASKPYGVDMDRDQKKEKPPKKASQKQSGNDSSSSSDLSSTPIIVGEIADTRSIKSKLWG